MAQTNKATGKQEANATDKQDSQKSGKSWLMMALILSLVMFLAIGISIGATLYLTGALRKSGHAEASSADKSATEGTDAHAAAKVSSAAPPQYISLDPPFIVNFEDQGMLRYLQIGVTVMTRDHAAADAVNNNMPPIRNNLIMLFASQKGADLGSSEGREKLRSQALEEIQSIIRKETGQPGVQAVYFTNFVMQ